MNGTTQALESMSMYGKALPQTSIRVLLQKATNSSFSERVLASSRAILKARPIFRSTNTLATHDGRHNDAYASRGEAIRLVESKKGFKNCGDK